MMRLLLRFAVVVVLVLGPWGPPQLAHAANLDTTADLVFGQQGMFTNAANNCSYGADCLYVPTGAVLDAQGNLYVADRNNNRVLEYDAPLTTGALASRVIGQPDVFTNTANSGGLNARSLYSPNGVALDAQGNLCVADALNNRVLEYDTPLSSGMAASRVFGQGGSFTSGTLNNGGRSAASLWGPIGVTLDTQGNLYVADAGNSRVLEYDAPLASGAAANRVFGQGGSFTSGMPNMGGSPTASSLYIPDGVALDVQGNLYVADSRNNRVLEYDAPLASGAAANRVFGQAGSFTTGTANNGGVSADSLAGPESLALDTQGNLVVADTSNNRVLEYDVPVPYGVPALSALSPSTVAAGSPAFTLTVNGSGFVPGSSVRWNGSDRPTTYLNSTQRNASISAGDVAAGGPFAVTVFNPLPGGGISSLMNLNLYARVGHDTTADTVQGQPSFAANSVNNVLMPGSANRLNSPNGAAVAGPSGRLYVADSSNNRVLSWPNAPAFANGQPADLVLGQPNFLVIDSNHGGLSAASLNYPSAAALDAQGNLYVADAGNNRVLEYNAPLSSGMAASRVFGQGGNFMSALSNNGGVSANGLSAPYGLALDAQGNLYVADFFNNRVLEYNTPLVSGTTANRVFGQPNSTSNTANSGGVLATSLWYPFGVAVDAQGNLYVSDYNNNRVLEYDAPLTTGAAANRVFGQGGSFTTGLSNNGGGFTPTSTSLSAPIGVGLDGWGHLYVADAGNSRVLEYDAPRATDAANRVFGQPDLNSAGINSGGLSADSLYGAWGVALDTQGNLYVADTLNNRLLEYDWASAKLYLPLTRR